MRIDEQFDLIKDDIDEKFDLVICSEILYYFTLDQLKAVVPKILNYLKKDGNLLSIHIRSLNDDTSGFPISPLVQRLFMISLSLLVGLRQWEGKYWRIMRLYFIRILVSEG